MSRVEGKAVRHLSGHLGRFRATIRTVRAAFERGERGGDGQLQRVEVIDSPPRPA